eukprot:5524347-Prymnesium_polylepis.1
MQSATKETKWSRSLEEGSALVCRVTHADICPYRVLMNGTPRTKAQLGVGLGQIGLLRVGDRHCTPTP